jgi:hypothetical protein
MLLRLLPILAAIGCGGAPFTLIETPPDAGFDAVPTAPDATPAADVTPEADRPDRFTVGRPDTGREAPDAGTEATVEDAAADTKADAIPDAGGDESAPPTDAPHETTMTVDVCVVPAPFTFACGSNRATTYAPGQYCVSINAGTSYQGTPMPMPTECGCSYTCACLLAHTVQVCQGRSLSGCSDTGGVAVGCQ